MGFRSRARRITRNGDINSQHLAAQREQRGIPGGFNTRKMVHAIRQLLVKRRGWGFAAERDGHDVIGVEAEIVSFEIEQAVQEQTRGNENDRGSCDLRTEQQIAKARTRRRPQSRTVIARTAAANANTRASRVASNCTGSCFVESAAASDFVVQLAARRPAMAPAEPSSAASASIWRINRQRPAPSAMRTINSRLRLIPRASRRFATLTQAINRTIPTTAMASCAASPNLSRTRERPCAIGSTTNPAISCCFSTAGNLESRTVS